MSTILLTPLLHTVNAQIQIPPLLPPPKMNFSNTMQLPTLFTPKVPPTPTIPPQPSTVKGFYTYTNSSHNFKIDYPINWSISNPDSLFSGDQVVEFLNSANTSKSIGDADLSVKDQTGKSYLDTNTMQVKSASLQDYVNQRKKVIDDLSIQDQNGLVERYVRDMGTTLGGLSAWRIEYESLIYGVPSLFNIEILTVKDNHLYTILFSSDTLKTPNNLPMFQKMVDSFQFIK